MTPRKKNLLILFDFELSEMIFKIRFYSLSDVQFKNVHNLSIRQREFCDCSNETYEAEFFLNE